MNKRSCIPKTEEESVVSSREFMGEDEAYDEQDSHY